jgi:acetoacetyl-CoA synthetase
MSNTKPLWQPSPSFQENSNLAHFMRWLRQKNITFNSYDALHQRSIEYIEEFWSLLLQYFNVLYSGSIKQVLQGEMPNAKWFDGIELNYAEHIFRNYSDENPAILFSSEDGNVASLSWKELSEKVSGLQRFFISKGIKSGDRIAAYLPNIPEATAAFLATNSIGAVWSSCSPDFGAQAVLDRFVQIEPKILIAIDGYRYGGKYFDRTDVVKEIVRSIPSIETVFIISSSTKKFSTLERLETIAWEEIKPSANKIQFTRVPFNHPIWVLYSSGTTGMPKAITHGTGGVLLEQLKYCSFHQDVKKGERCFWYTTTGWMMWNYLHGCMLAGGTMVLYDGHPAYPNRNALWKLIDQFQIAHFGISGSFIVSNMKSDIEPRNEFNLSSLRSIGSTGSPLPGEGFRWIYEKVKSDVWLTSMSGGTDVCSAFVGGNPLLPVYEGEIQCVALGCDRQVWDEAGKQIYNQEGEMVITKPMPCMPIYFWNDPDKKKYLESYFEMYPGVWRHGDWIKQTENGGTIIYGRSDATLNRGGVRIGSAEIYKTMDKIAEVKDSLIVCLDKPGGEFYMPLFVLLNEGKVLDETLKKKIKQKLKTGCSPRHVPDEIIACPDIPYTLSGKKTETPVKKILMGQKMEKVVNVGSLRNPASLKYFAAFFERQKP